MSRYQSIDFSDARERAFNHISRLFNAQKIAPDGADSKYIEVWEVELEIDTTEETKCLNVRVLLTPEFPLQIPYIFIDKDELAGLNFPPNINSGGEICTFDRNTSVSNPETPEILVEECIRRAKIIIEHGYSDDHIDSYTSEFIAYWEGRYGEEEEVDTSILFLIDEFGGPPEQVTYVILKKKLGKFHSLVFSSEKNFEVIKVFLDRHQISYDTIPTFYIGQLDQLKPPFQIDNGTVKTLLDSRNQVTPFREYLNSKPILPIVTFYYKINDRILVLGWCHNPVELKERKRGNKILQSEKHLYPERYNRLLSPQNGSIPVKRFSPQVLTHNRLIQRTAADYTDTYSLDSCTVSVVGLGSVGSFLASYLASAGIRSFWLVDSESLSVENIGRHLLGLKDVGRNKAESIADYLQWKNPLTKVHVCKRRIIQAIQSEPEFINQCDYHFICIGDFNTESWIASNMNRDEWNRPVFFIWVEPSK